MARFYDLNGKRRNRSTKTEDRKEARKLAVIYEDAARRRRTALQSRRVIAALHKEITGEGLPVSTVTGVLQTLARGEDARNEARDDALLRERGAGSFSRSLGIGRMATSPKSQRSTFSPIGQNRLRTLSARTVNHGVKFLRMVFRAAREDATIADNPAEFVRVVKDAGGRKSRRPFTLPELRAVLGVADEEWKSMILFGLYSGQRLGDVARLTWANLDLQAGELRLATAKTGKRIIQPLAGPLKAHVESLPGTDDPQAPIHPRAFQTVGRQGKTGGLSNQFSALLSEAGLRERAPHRKTHGEGRGVGSSSGGLSFHCLRHTAVSLLKEAGIPAATVMELVGHDSTQMSEVYTHIGHESLKQAAEAFPDLASDISK